MSQTWDAYSGGESVHVNLGTRATAKLESLRTLFSGDTEPASTVARMLWADTATKLLKQRNAENTDWVTIGVLCAPTHRTGFTIHVGTVSASKNVFLLCMPHAMTVEQVSLLCSAGIAANDTNFWAAQIANLTQAEELISADKTTEATGGEEIVADTPWDLDPDQNLSIAAYDVLEVQLVKTASADDLADLAISFVGYPTGA